MIRHWRLILNLLIVCQVTAGLARQEPAEEKTKGWALLIGCTTYASLGEGLQLEGPGNDVLMMRDLLVRHFKFAPENITVLAEAAGGEALRPTRANIEREFARLAKVAARGEQVVILMAGHGSQQPDQDPPSKDDPEPDGLDEIFLPADVGPWEDSVGQVKNSIVDDDLHVWLTKIQDKGASMWLIMDSCHSGTMLRGVDEVSRQVLPEKLVPAAVLKKAQVRREQDEKGRGREETASTLNLADDAPSLVAIYAAQSNEPTVEKYLPPGNAERKRLGLLTYTMNQILTQATEPMSYQELVQRVQSQYVAWGRTGPTPLIEGQDKDREVLGKQKWPGRSRIQLSVADGKLTINAVRSMGCGPAQCWPCIGLRAKSRRSRSAMSGSRKCSRTRPR